MFVNELYNEWWLYAGIYHVYNHVFLSISYYAEHFLIINILVIKFNSACHGILFIMMLYNMIELKNFSWNQSLSISQYYLNKAMDCSVQKTANLIPLFYILIFIVAFIWI